MAEPIFARVRRVVSANVEDTVDRMERSGGPKVMAEAIREVDRIVDEVRAEHEGATARRLQALRQKRMIVDKLAALDGKARFALAEKRDDLAEAAIARQIELEAQSTQLDTVQSEATEEEARLEECRAQLATRKAEMEGALAAYQSAHRDSEIGGDGAPRPKRNHERTVERAERAFDRAMGGAGVVASVRLDAQAGAKVAEIDVMQKSAVIARRMAAMRADQPAA